MNNKKVNLSSNQEAMLSDKWTDVIRVGNWENSYKDFRIVAGDLSTMMENFNSNVLRLDQGEVPFNFSHHSTKDAAGWIESLRIEAEVLQAKVRWTSKGRQKIEDEQFKYVSAEIAMNYLEDESGAKHGMTLTGAALTNIPFVRGMKAVALSENSKEADLYIFNSNNRMQKFKELMAKFSDKETITSLELATIKGAFVMLSDEEQAETKPEVDAVEAKIESETEEKADEEETTDEAADVVVEEVAEAEAEVELSNTQENKVLETTRSEVVTLNARIIELEKNELDRNVSSELNSLVLSGQILQKEVAANKTLAMNLNESNRTQFLDILKNREKVIALGEVIGHGNDNSDIEASSKNKTDDTESIQVLAKELQKTMNLSVDDSVFEAMRQLSK